MVRAYKGHAADCKYLVYLGGLLERPCACMNINEAFYMRTGRSRLVKDEGTLPHGIVKQSALAEGSSGVLNEQRRVPASKLVLKMCLHCILLQRGTI